MISLPPSVRIFLASGATDMRKQFNGLERATREVICQDPLSGHLFVFCNRRRDRLKILVWDTSGYWLLAKRLERGTFAWPQASDDDRSVSGIEMRSEELAALLGGLDITQLSRRRWWRRDASSRNYSTPSAAHS
jgi:transposase